MLVWQVPVPPAPLTDRAYVLVLAGVTLRLPFTLTVPIPWLSDAAVAFVEVQVRGELAPAVIVAGLAEIEQVAAGVAGGWLTVMLTWQVPFPPAPLTDRV